MARQQHLRKAPITEALIDIRVKLPAGGNDPNKIRSLHEKIKDQFPQEKEIRHFEMEFQSGPPPEQKTRSSHTGYRYDSSDGHRVLQAKVDGFTFSRLRPYENWESLREEAKSMWELYCEVLQPEEVVRVATRYINEIVIPGPLIDFDHYLTMPPSIPKTLPQVLAGFFTRIVVPHKDKKVNVIITQAFEPGGNPDKISVILDIDVISGEPLHLKDDIWGMIDSLRDIKNQVFFESITERAAELFT